jgi:tight adherence protein B
MRLGLEGVGLALALVIGTVAGLAVPQGVLRFKRSKRLGKFEGQFASALDSLANAMEVGLSLSQALETVSRDMPAPLGPEFTHVVRGLGMGLPLAEALDQLADRVPLRDVEIFVTAVHIQYRTGGALTQVLRNIATTVRQRVNLRSEIRAMTAQQRFSAYLISGLPVLIALSIKFLSPEYFSMLLAPGTMRILLVGGCCGIVVGFFVMLRIADIEV